MTDYGIEDQFAAMGHSCRHFKSNATDRNRAYDIDEGISCISCRNWTGNGCVVKNAFHDMLARLDR